MRIILAGLILAGQAAAITIMAVVMPGLVSVPSSVPETLHFGACEIPRADSRNHYYL
jgi:hypothetical protein